MFESGRKDAEEVRTLLIYLFLGFPLAANAQLFGPSTYEDCVLRGLKDAKTDGAVASVHAMCRSKFPEKALANGNKVPGICVLHWDGLRTVKLSSEPKDWRKSFQKWEISVHDMPVAHVFVPNSFKESPQSKSQMYEQVSIFCRH